MADTLSDQEEIVYDEETLRRQAELIESQSLESLMEDISVAIESLDSVDEEIPLIDFEMEPALESMMGVLGAIRDNESISRSDVTTINQLISSMEGMEDPFENIPLISFTELPSKVNYDVAMEGVLSNVARYVIEAIKKIILAIKTTIQKSVGFFRKNVVTAKKVEQVSKRVSSSYRSKDIDTKLKKAVVDGDVIRLPDDTEVKLDELSVLIAEKNLISNMMSAVDNVVNALQSENSLTEIGNTLPKVDALVNQIIDPNRVAGSVNEVMGSLRDMRLKMIELNNKPVTMDPATASPVISALAKNIDVGRDTMVSKQMERITTVIAKYSDRVKELDKQVLDLRRQVSSETEIKELETRSKTLWGAALIMGSINDILGYIIGKIGRVAQMLYKLQMAK
jgi:hypothetical protein